MHYHRYVPNKRLLPSRPHKAGGDGVAKTDLEFLRNGKALPFEGGFSDVKEERNDKEAKNNKIEFLCDTEECETFRSTFSFPVVHLRNYLVIA